MAAGTNLQAACGLNKIRWSCVWPGFALLLWNVPGLRSVCWKIPAIWVKMDTLPSLTEWGFRRHNHIFMKRRQGMHPELSGQYCD